MKERTRLVRLTLWLGLLAFVGCNPFQCVPGSTVSVEPSDGNCNVDLTDHSTLFRIEMTLSCEGELTDCYVIESLSCGGEEKADAVPIDLRNTTDGCPGADYCIADCRDGVDLPGTIWDTPSLLAVDGCNVYEDVDDPL